MNFLDIFKKTEKEEDTQEVKVNKQSVKNRHSARISNLRDEFECLSNELVDIELNIAMARAEKEKSSDRIIRRITLIKYEIEIREGLLKWLC